jgi:hypothetical protein
MIVGEVKASKIFWLDLEWSCHSAVVVRVFIFALYLFDLRARTRNFKKSD